MARIAHQNSNPQGLPPDSNDASVFDTDRNGEPRIVPNLNAPIRKRPFSCASCLQKKKSCCGRAPKCARCKDASKCSFDPADIAAAKNYRVRNSGGASSPRQKAANKEQHKPNPAEDQAAEREDRKYNMRKRTRKQFEQSESEEDFHYDSDRPVNVDLDTDEFDDTMIAPKRKQGRMAADKIRPARKASDYDSETGDSNDHDVSSDGHDEDEPVGGSGPAGNEFEEDAFFKKRKPIKVLPEFMLSDSSESEQDGDMVPRRATRREHKPKAKKQIKEREGLASKKPNKMTQKEFLMRRKVIATAGDFVPMYWKALDAEVDDAPSPANEPYQHHLTTEAEMETETEAQAHPRAQLVEQSQESVPSLKRRREQDSNDEGETAAGSSHRPAKKTSVDVQLAVAGESVTADPQRFKKPARVIRAPPRDDGLSSDDSESGSEDEDDPNLSLEVNKMITDAVDEFLGEYKRLAKEIIRANEPEPVRKPIKVMTEEEYNALILQRFEQHQEKIKKREAKCLGLRRSIKAMSDGEIRAIEDKALIKFIYRHYKGVPFSRTLLPFAEEIVDLIREEDEYEEMDDKEVYEELCRRWDMCWDLFVMYYTDGYGFTEKWTEHMTVQDKLDWLRPQIPKAVTEFEATQFLFCYACVSMHGWDEDEDFTMARWCYVEYIDTRWEWYMDGLEWRFETFGRDFGIHTDWVIDELKRDMYKDNRLVYENDIFVGIRPGFLEVANTTISDLMEEEEEMGDGEKADREEEQGDADMEMDLE